jgi:hypothetical protein
VYDQLPLVHDAVPFWTAVPEIAIETLALSPAAVPHVPPRAVTGAFVEYGNVRGAPLTDVKLTLGAVRSMTIDWPPLVPLLPPMSVCVAVTV